MLEIINLDFEYHDKHLLKDVHFQLNPGDLLHICGKNGAGKTTLLRIIAGIFEPDLGKICFEGEDIQHHKANWQEQLSFVGHKSSMHPTLTVAENLYFDLQGKHSQNDIIDYLIHAGLGDLSNRFYGTLSMGQQRRVTLLRPVLSEAKIWLLDEPFVALDASMMDWFMNHIMMHRKQDGYVLLTSHQPLPNPGQYQEYWL